MLTPSTLLRKWFKYEPTSGQEKLFGLLDNFVLDKITEKPVLMIRGYAGTGKTTVMGAFVKVLASFSMKYLLLAPTGRAAKVMSSYAKTSAFTIHKRIYKVNSEPGSGSMAFVRQKNYHKDTIFIVDEASMLSNDAAFGDNGLLHDLIGFVFENPNAKNRLIIIGDNAQLPPVGQENSPGLDIEYLRKEFRVEPDQIELTEVMRQEEESGILFNATTIRNFLLEGNLAIKLATSRFKDVYKMTGERLEEGLRYAYDKYSVENTIIICRSNKSAVEYNRYIRHTIHFFENEIEAGDQIMIVRNNYLWLPEDSPVGFLANGDFAEVMKIKKIEEMHGFRFADLELRLIDYPDHHKIEAKVILDTLMSPQASMPSSDYIKLYNEVSKDYEDVSSKAERKRLLKIDPYLNALQIKFAYALTCHKSQGGQWPAVFVDQGYMTDEHLNLEYLRWMYTAITRATDELFLVNFNKNFF